MMAPDVQQAVLRQTLARATLLQVVKAMSKKLIFVRMVPVDGSLANANQRSPAEPTALQVAHATNLVFAR